MTERQKGRLLDLAKTAGLLANPDLTGNWPAIVESYDAARGLATVHPAIRNKDRTTGKAYDMGPYRVPVLWHRAGEGVDDGHLVEGDEVLLVPCTPTFGAWLLAGGTQDGAGAGAVLGNAFAVPMGASSKRRPSPPPVGTMRRGRPDGTATVLVDVTSEAPARSIKIQAPSVSLGSASLPKKKVGRDGDPVLADPVLVAWGAAIATFTGGAIPNPWTPATPVGAVQATSTEVEST